MRNDTLLTLIKRCNTKKGVELISKKAYLFNREFHINLEDGGIHIGRYQIIVLLYKGKKAGGILKCGDSDLHWIILEKYRGFHILSEFLKSGFLNKVWPENTKISLTDVHSKSVFERGVHLAELANLEVTKKIELQSLFENMPD